MTKAERIYNKTRRETQKHIEQWGYNPETDGGWSGGMFANDDELIYRRTFNEIQKLLDRDIKMLETDIKLGGILSPERRELLEKTYCMIQKTMKNQYIA